MSNTSAPLKLLVLGAHPDDAEIGAGGLITMYRAAGHTVKMVSVTCGDAGHQSMCGPPLATRRRRELAASAATCGATSEVWEHPDGHLLPTLELRWQIVRELRTFAPDLVLTHRTNDYHPDHRAVGQGVQDASYMVTVPNVVKDVPILKRDPVIAYFPDRFTRPNPLKPDVVIDIGQKIERIVDMLCCHESQFFEWLPFNQQIAHEVPADTAGRRAWLRGWYVNYMRPRADRFRAALVARYGEKRGQAVEYCEAFEISEHASALDDASRRRLFGFLD